MNQARIYTKKNEGFRAVSLPFAGIGSLFVRATITVTNRFRDVVGRVTPWAPFGKRSADRGAHGVTRPTRALHDVTKFICRGTSNRVTNRGATSRKVTGLQRYMSHT